MITIRFSIRDLFWLTAVVALAVGWWLDHAQLRHEREQIAKQQVEMQLKMDALDKLRESVKMLLDRQPLK